MPLIKTIAEIKEYVEVSTLTEIDSLLPSIRIAERRHLRPVIGDALYNHLVTIYTAEPPDISDEDQKILELCQEAVANIAMYLAVTRLSVQIDEAGVRRSESTSQKTAFQYQEVNVRESFANAGFDALEDILQVLDENQDDYPDWSNSTAFDDYKKYFIQSGLQFTNYYEIKRSRLTYITIRSIMVRIENFVVKKITGSGFFDVLKTGIKEDMLSEAYEKLLEDYIRPGVALLTVSKALIERMVDVTDNGVTVSIIDNYRNTQVRNSAPLEKAIATAKQLYDDGNLCLQNLSQELALNPTLYPDFTAPVTQQAQITINNKLENGFYGF